jgi:hypothetical protein
MSSIAFITIPRNFVQEEVERQRVAQQMMKKVARALKSVMGSVKQSANSSSSKLRYTAQPSRNVRKQAQSAQSVRGREMSQAKANHQQMARQEKQKAAQAIQESAMKMQAEASSQKQALMQKAEVPRPVVKAQLPAPAVGAAMEKARQEAVRQKEMQKAHLQEPLRNREAAASQAHMPAPPPLPPEEAPEEKAAPMAPIQAPAMVSLNWRNPDQVLKSAREMGYEVRSGGYLQLAEEVDEPVDFLFTRKGSAPVGVKRQGDSLLFISRDQALSKSFIGPLSQSYNLGLALSFLKQKGYRINNITRDTRGVIKLNAGSFQ